MLWARELTVTAADSYLVLVQVGSYKLIHLTYATLGVLERVLDSETGTTDPMA